MKRTLLLSLGVILLSGGLNSLMAQGRQAHVLETSSPSMEKKAGPDSLGRMAGNYVGPVTTLPGMEKRGGDSLGRMSGNWVGPVTTLPGMEKRGGDSLGRMSGNWVGPVTTLPGMERRGGDSLGRMSGNWVGPVSTLPGMERRGGDSLGRVSDVFEIQLMAYPNPASGLVNLRFFANEETTAVITLLNVEGRECLQAKTATVRGENGVSLDLNGLSAGIYHARLQMGAAVEVRKVMVQ